jgi:hypothetical protein
MLLILTGCDFSGTVYYKIIYKENNNFYIMNNHNTEISSYFIYQPVIDIKVSDFINQITTFPVEIIVTKDKDGKWIDVKRIN